MTNIESESAMGEFVKRFIEANPSLGQEVKDDIDEIVGEIYVIFAEDQWGKKQRRTGQVIELFLLEQDGVCALMLAVTSDHLMEFDLHSIRWTLADGWTARARRLNGPIELKTLSVEFK